MYVQQDCSAFEIILAFLHMQFLNFHHWFNQDQDFHEAIKGTRSKLDNLILSNEITFRSIQYHIVYLEHV